jgi:hypothetical protein
VLLPPPQNLHLGCCKQTLFSSFSKRKLFLKDVVVSQDTRIVSFHLTRGLSGSAFLILFSGNNDLHPMHERPTVIFQEEWFSELLLPESPGEPVSMPALAM